MAESVAARSESLPVRFGADSLISIARSRVFICVVLVRLPLAICKKRLGSRYHRRPSKCTNDNIAFRCYPTIALLTPYVSESVGERGSVLDFLLVVVDSCLLD